MSFKELDGFIDLGIHCIALNQASIIRARQAMKPALIRIHDMLSNRGIRNDLNDVPVITWKTFCHNKKMLGCKRTLDALIKDAGLDNPTKQQKLLVGDKAILLANGTDRPVSHVAEVTLVHEKTNPKDDTKIDITYQTQNGAKTKTVRTTEVEKVKTAKVPVLNTGDLVVLLDIEGGAEFRYDGGGILTRTDTSSKAEAARLAQDEKDVASARRKREAEAKKKEAEAAKKAAKKKAAEEKDAAKKKEAAKIAAAKKGAAAKPKVRASKRNGLPTSTMPYVAHQLGDKFFVFAKDEVEISIRTARSSQHDTLELAQENAKVLNIKYGFATEAAAVS